MAIIADGRERWRIKEGDESPCKQTKMKSKRQRRRRRKRRRKRRGKKRSSKTSSGRLLPAFLRNKKVRKETAKSAMLFLLIQASASLSRSRGDTGRRHTSRGNGSGKRGQTSRHTHGHQKQRRVTVGWWVAWTAVRLECRSRHPDIPVSLSPAFPALSLYPILCLLFSRINLICCISLSHPCLTQRGRRRSPRFHP